MNNEEANFNIVLAIVNKTNAGTMNSDDDSTASPGTVRAAFLHAVRNFEECLAA